MRWRRYIAGAITVLLLSCYFLSSQSRLLPPYFRLPAPHPLPAETREARLRQDLAYLTSQLPRLHVDAFHSLARTQFDQAIQTLDDALPVLSDFEFMVGVMQILARIGDAHTEAFPPFEVELRLCPLQLIWFADGIYLTYATPEFQDAIGARLVQIGDTPIEDAIGAATSVIPHENKAGLRKQMPRVLLNPAMLVALGIQKQEQKGRYTFERTNGSRCSLDVAPVDYQDYLSLLKEALLSSQQPLHLRNPDEHYWFDYMEDESTIYFHYRRCAAMDTLSFPDFNRQLFSFIDEHSVERLVIDLRHNGGGNSGILAPFIEKLRRHPRLNREDRIFVIIGGATFSSAVLNAIELRQQTEAIIVGAPTSSSPNHFGEVKTFVLPNSGMFIKYATKYFDPAPGFDAASLEPDILIEPTIDDYLEGRDPVMRSILSTPFPPMKGGGNR